MTPPRVLHAVEQFLPRTETFVYTIVTGHQRYEPSVICHARAYAYEFPFPRVEVLPNPVSLRTAAGWIAASIRRATGRSLWERAAGAVVKRTRPDVMHAHFGPIGCEMLAIAKAARLPLVISLYGVDAAVLPYLARWSDQYDALFREGTMFLAEGPKMRAKIIAAGAPEERTFIHPISLDLSKYPKWAPDGTSNVLYASRFVEKKGLLDAIAAFGRARVRLPHARMTIVGDGPDDEMARALRARLGLADCVDFVGMQSHPDLIRRLTAASVIIHPSATAVDGDSEGGAPTILLEAQAIGTPIVSTRHADIPHIVHEGPGAILCAEHDVGAFADGLVATMEGAVPSDSAGVLARHDMAQEMPKLEKLYDLAIERAKSGPAS